MWIDAFVKYLNLSKVSKREKKVLTLNHLVGFNGENLLWVEKIYETVLGCWHTVNANLTPLIADRLKGFAWHLKHGVTDSIKVLDIRHCKKF